MLAGFDKGKIANRKRNKHEANITTTAASPNIVVGDIDQPQCHKCLSSFSFIIFFCFFVYV